MLNVRKCVVAVVVSSIFAASCATAAEKAKDPSKIPVTVVDGTAEGVPDVIKGPPPLPKDFAFTFSMPYGLGDEFPREPEEFDRMLRLLKSAGYNTVHCPYEEWRVPLFKKHGMKMMIDVLAWKPPIEADIRRPRQRHKVKAMCLKIKGSDAVWGYNLWNERLDWCGNFKHLDGWVRMLRTWDGTHPIWVGTYRYLYCEHFPTHQGVCAWYDYHWARGFGWNLSMLKFYRKIAAKRRSVMGKWLLVHDYNRNLYTLNTSIAHGVKIVLWFISGPYLPREKDKSKRWHEDHHLVRIGRHMQPLYKLIGEMGLPYAVYSTPTRRDASNRDKKPGMPASTTAFPKDFWLTVKQGEVICGLFKLADKSDVVYMTNNNAYGWQGVVLDIEQEKDFQRVAYEFDRKTAQWKKLGILAELNLAVAPADARVLRFERVKRTGETVKPEAVKWDPMSNIVRIGKVLKDKGFAASDKPYAVYSTPAARTADNREKEPGLPKGAKAFPENHWVTVKQGEMLCGHFKLKDGSDAVVFSNHNGLAFQGGLVVPKQTKETQIIMSEFDQKSGKWAVLGAWTDINFSLAPKGNIVLKFERKEVKKPAPKK